MLLADGALDLSELNGVDASSLFWTGPLGFGPAMERFRRIQDRVADVFFGKLADVAEKHPLPLLLVSSVVFLALASLLFIFPPVLEARPEALWTPKGSRAEREMFEFNR